MMNLDRILCPVTLPPKLDAALRCAVSLAGAYHARLLLFHCACGPPLVRALTGAKVDGQLKQSLSESLQRDLGPPGSPTRWHLVAVESDHDVGDEIVLAARQKRIDLIVMRSRRSPVATLLGSTAEHICRHAPCPVLVIQAAGIEGDEEQLTEIGFKRILVAHDFSSSSELALSYALSLASKYGAELHVLHVLPEPAASDPEIAWTETSLESAHYWALQRLQKAVPKDVKQPVTHAVRWGRPYREILAYAREQQIDLLCMGAQGKDYGLGALFGSNVDRVLRQASCPVLIARPLQSALVSNVDVQVMKTAEKKSFPPRLSAST